MAKKADWERDYAKLTRRFEREDWAWDFLRRNRSYREEWSELFPKFGEVLVSRDWAVVEEFTGYSRKDGIWHLLSLGDSYSPFFGIPMRDCRRKWGIGFYRNPDTENANFDVMGFCKRDGSRAPGDLLNPGEPAPERRKGLAFLVEPALPIGPQLDRIGDQASLMQEVLAKPPQPRDEYLRDLAEIHGWMANAGMKVPRIRHPKTNSQSREPEIRVARPKLNQRDWPLYLQLLDARFQGASYSEIGAKLFPPGKLSPNADNVKMVGNRLQRARRMTRPEQYLKILGLPS